MITDLKDLVNLAKYPFLPEATEYIQREDVGVEEILRDDGFARAREFGFSRILSSIKNEIRKGFIDERICFDVIISYPISKAFVWYIGDNFLKRRHAIFEAKRAFQYLQKESDDFVKEFSDKMGIEWENNEIDFVYYLKYAPNNYGQWKLTNSKLFNGKVEAGRQKALRILQEAIRERVSEPIRIDEKTRDLLGSLDLSEIYSELSKRRIHRKKIEGISFPNFPPCMKNIISQIEANLNVSHMGRFALTAFLNSMGMRSEEILKTLSPTPDFNEAVARYQVEHITGVTSGKKYSPPSCDTMKTYGLCFEPDNLCRSIKHPLNYYILKMNKGFNKQKFQ